MSLAPGDRLGVYEIVDRIGAGGMGEVYRANDTTLGRFVAIKALPEAFAADPERLARFEREARTLAALNHPRIAQIYGLERTGPVPSLVMELVEGPTLAARLAEGPIPLEDALSIARQVAEALAASHEKGIVHRDLKPSNIAFTADGQVKVLDFGLAKLTVDAPASASSATFSPTITSPALLTGAGILLGTAAYMSPEQARGKDADRRADVWAFGCVLYEMLTGRRPFDGEDATETIGAVVRLEPDWQALPAGCPPALRALLKRCLEKDRQKRVADITTALFVLDELAALPSAAAAASDSKDAGRRSPGLSLMLIGAAALVTIAAVATAGTWWLMRPAAPHVTRLTITPPETATLSIDRIDRDLAITPDGTRVVYAGADGTQLFVRALDSLEPTALAPLNGGAQGIFASPDGQWAGYVEDNITLKKVAMTGGPPVTLLRMDGNSRGVTWTDGDAIVFATSARQTGLQSVSASGGELTVLTRPDPERGEADHLWPSALPGGRFVLFTITATEGGLDAAQIAVLDLATQRYTPVLRGGTQPHYAASGHLVYAAGSTLRAVRFDPDRLETHGIPVPVVPRLLTTGVGAADFDVSRNGTLVYADTPGDLLRDLSLLWVDRQGTETPLKLPRRAYNSPRLSPDGSRLAVAIQSDQSDVWISELERSTLTRLTFHPGFDGYPEWMPDGRRVVYTSDRNGGPDTNLFLQSADGGGLEQLTDPPGRHGAAAIAPDGTIAVVKQEAPGGPAALRLLPPGRKTSNTRGASTGTALAEEIVAFNASYSPDGRWIAYEARSSGREEVYVRPVPDMDAGQWQVSTGGGRQPVWARDGREIFFVAPDGAIWSAGVDPRGVSPRFTTPEQVVPARYSVYLGSSGFGTRMYDVSPDGQRFLMLQAGVDQSRPQMIVVQHWFEELNRLVPAD
jgi:serine/threonine-protein kinase